MNCKRYTGDEAYDPTHGLLGLITCNDGREFRVRLVLRNWRYGREGCLLHDDASGLGPMVEFLCGKNAGKPGWGPLGQFVSRYHISTLTEDAPALMAGGLNLDCGVPRWSLDPKAMREAFGLLLAALAALADLTTANQGA